ncbi:MAG: RNHCP domain-containing protein [bacterium]|nr:RNHCP domain-containing protein [bacterium]
MKKFTMIDEEFICKMCDQLVSPLGYTARDHCPFCLCSLHVDVNPGDRASACRGILIPRGVIKTKKGWQIEYKCDRCGIIKRNIVANDDNFELILDLMRN